MDGLKDSGSLQRPTLGEAGKASCVLLCKTQHSDKYKDFWAHSAGKKGGLGEDATSCQPQIR